jgi:hypothetical protein
MITHKNAPSRTRTPTILSRIFGQFLGGFFIIVIFEMRGHGMHEFWWIGTHFGERIRIDHLSFGGGCMVVQYLILTKKIIFHFSFFFFFAFAFILFYVGMWVLIVLGLFVKRKSHRFTTHSHPIKDPSCK